ncbi:universal stress protein [Georgenia sp. SYP-B2076]|uniref:universal stress protein n=1 Tax=Georgenia sp. SYP-B2076 TaxID=2495881 RepID=UPI000F8F5A46|nr:universal stress protein [Georgenia sp. SYP-B2076]
MSIIVGYIPTPEGRAALHRAAEEAKLRHTKLVVVNSHRGSDFDAEEARTLEREFEDVVRDLRAAGIEHEVRTLVRGNEPADDLVKVAAESDADFIVIGLRRRSPVGKLILGSNAQTILLEADCPVLAVKAR